MFTISSSLKGPTVILPLVKVTVVAGEPVEIQVTVDGDSGVNSRGSTMIGRAIDEERVHKFNQEIQLLHFMILKINYRTQQVINTCIYAYLYM